MVKENELGLMEALMKVNMYMDFQMDLEFLGGQIK